ncbi:MAG: gliding-motility protein MglA [Candidatus Cloacimonetes bacterium 4572_55]|nr:MAG: gliding-motility protein MglA [Candidatus Cloacimonetes bacterium 4572_55]
MAIINYVSSELNCKLVFYGPGLSGKTTNLQYIHNKLSPSTRGKLISLSTAGERTLFFDFLPINLGKIRGLMTRIHVYTVPGQVYYNESRKLVLRGLDGLVFIADSQESRWEANIFSYQNMIENLKSHRIDLEELPFVIQYNKRDVSNILPVSLLQKELNPTNQAAFEACALSGEGVFNTLKAASRQVIQSVSGQLRKK